MTIKDLAAKTGYGVATVSRVLNNHPNVSEKARRAILEAVEKSGFQINANAQQLKQLHSSSVLVVVKGTSNELFAELVEALQTCMTQAEYPLIVDYLDENANEVLRAVQLCREKKPRGILFLGGNRQNFLEDFHKIDAPAVLITNDASGLPFDNLSSVSTDDRAGARCAMETLIDLGHREIAVIGGEIRVSDTSRLRYEGCREALAAKGVEFDEARDYRAVRFSYEGGYQAARDLLESGRRFTALFAFSDVMAIGAIRALRDAGKRVPEDISVVGFDGLPIGSYLVPQLTTIAQPVADMAEKGVQILLAAIEEGKQACYETVPFALYPRESTRSL